jgi:hypothetical protein
MADRNQNQDQNQSRNQNRDQDQSGRVSQADSSQENRTDKLGRDPVFGRGMTSPDSTEAVLSAETGEVDPRARGEGSLTSGDTRGHGGSRNAEEESHLSAGKSGGKKGSSHKGRS